MKILNVIERSNSGNISVASFTDGDANKAEKLFIDKATKNGAIESDIDYLLDEGYYENDTYELYLTWNEN